MRRREFIGALGAVATSAWPLVARAQPLGQRRIGFLSISKPDDTFGKAIGGAFAQALAALGWNDGANLKIDWRWYGADAALARRQAAELLAAKPDVLLAGGNPAVEALRRQTQTIPIVFALVSDPVGLGYVESLASPGGNI